MERWMSRQEKRNGRATEWRPVIGTVRQKTDTIRRHDWKELQKRGEQGVSYIIRRNKAYSELYDENRYIFWYQSQM